MPLKLGILDAWDAAKSSTYQNEIYLGPPKHQVRILPGPKFMTKMYVEPLGYLVGQGDLETRLRMGIIGVTIWVLGVINLLTKSP